MQSGKLRVLGVTTPKRMAQLPDSPTLAESGFPGFEVNNWQGLFAPARTPAPVIERARIERATRVAFKRPASHGAEPAVAAAAGHYAGKSREPINAPSLR